MLCEINHYPENRINYEEPSWLDMEVDAAHADNLEAFCQRNLIPFKRQNGTSDKLNYQFREGWDYDDVVSFLLLQEDAPYSVDVMNEINFLAFSRMYYTPNFAYEETLQRTEADNIILSQFV